MNLKHYNKDIIDVVSFKTPIRELFGLKNVLVNAPAVFDRSKIVYSTNFYIGYEGTENIMVTFNIGNYNESLKQITFSSITFQANGKLSQGLPDGSISITVGNYSNVISGILDINEGLDFWGMSGSFINATVTFNINEWNNILVSPSSSYYEIQKQMYFENNQHFMWHFRGRFGYSIPYPDDNIYEFDYQTDININWLTNKIPPLKAFFGDRIIKYLGYGPRNQFGLDGGTLNYVYDEWEIVEGVAPIDPNEPDPQYLYKWVFVERIEVYAAAPPYDIQDTTVGVHYSETVLNSLVTPNANTYGTVARDLISNRQISPGVYLNTYDYWEIQRIAY